MAIFGQAGQVKGLIKIYSSTASAFSDDNLHFLGIYLFFFFSLHFLFSCKPLVQSPSTQPDRITKTIVPLIHVIKVHTFVVRFRFTKVSVDCILPGTRDTLVTIFYDAWILEASSCRLTVSPQPVPSVY